MKKNYIITLIACLACVGMVSCNKDEAYSPALPGVRASVPILPDVLSVESPVEVKSGGDCLGEKSLVSASEDDGFSITEYASRIDDAIPATRGFVIDGSTNGASYTGNFVDKYGKFNVMSFLDTLNTTTKLREDISEGPLEVEFDGGWKWDVADAPTWRTSTPTTFWSYAPVDALETIGLTSVSGGSPEADTTTVLSFSHTVPASLTDQKDLLFAYNVETRHFKTDANGKYIKDANGHFQLVDGESNKFTVKFAHALSAVKFRLNSSSAGANVHSITLCYLDSDNNIVKNVGVAKSGDCAATGSGEGSGSLSFAWSNLGTYKPLRYTFPDTYSNPADASTVAGNYTNTGEGVMFMIPQTLSRTITTAEGKTANLKIIVEFSKYGSSQYYTVVRDFKVKRNNADADITWNAGYYYLYELQIGEFHVPGEYIPGLNHIAIDKLMTTGTTGQKIPNTPFKIKGVKTMGLVIESYGLGVDDDSKQVVMYGLFGTTNSSGQSVVNDRFSGVSASTILTKPQEAFDFNFANVSQTPRDNTNNMIYEFGQGGNTLETYYLYYNFEKTEGKNKNPTEKKGPYYAAFRIPDNTDVMQIMVKSVGSDNSCGFAMTPRCFVVLEVQKDPNLPNNWNTIHWSDYL